MNDINLHQKRLILKYDDMITTNLLQNNEEDAIWDAMFPNKDEEGEDDSITDFITNIGE